jgi:2-C-methyl-D-erythritol 4-phosphate cytidylyltransferase/2-C-methyl-D-erythritol 2,4-cyclodiphosphate synthase
VSSPDQLAIVLVAAGASSRMGFPKLWTPVCGAPLLAHAIAAAQAAQPAELVLVVGADRLGAAAVLAPGVRSVAGGARRRDSVAAGLAATTAPWVAIHDAARALAPPELFARGLLSALPTGAAIPVLPLKDTIKRVADGHVAETPPRAEHVVVQTPQLFRRDLLERALALSDADVTDEAALVEQLGVRVAIFEGDERAFKVTTPLDFALVRAVLDADWR